MMKLLSGSAVGRNLTTIIQAQTFWVLPQLSHWYFIPPTAHTGCCILSISGLHRVSSSRFCTAFSTARWFHSDKQKSSLRCLLSFYPLERHALLLFVYCSSLLQVQSEIRRKWRRWMLQRFLGADTKYQQPSIGSNGNNFSTQITMLTKCSPTTRRASACQEHLSAF